MTVSAIIFAPRSCIETESGWHLQNILDFAWTCWSSRYTVFYRVNEFLLSCGQNQKILWVNGAASSFHLKWLILTQNVTFAGHFRRQKESFDFESIDASNQTRVQLIKVLKLAEVGIPWLCILSAQNPFNIISNWLLFDYKPRCGPLKMENKWCPQQEPDWLLSRWSAQPWKSNSANSANLG